MRTGRFRLLAGAIGGEQVRHHDQCAVVVLDHPLEEEPIELGAACIAQPLHFRGAQHAGHAGMRVRTMPCMRAMTVVRVLVRQRLATVRQPAPHQPHLVLLRCLDALRQQADVAAGRALRDHCRHLHRLRVVDDHVAHELGVRRHVSHAADPRCLGRAHGTARLARRTAPAPPAHSPAHRRTRRHDRRTRTVCAPPAQAPASSAMPASRVVFVK
jgi:hypothetical protein